MLRLVNASKFEDVALFTSIAIEIASKCNRRCYFCPNGYNEQPDVYMPMELITKALTELQYLKYKGRIEWYIYNEPTRDKRLLDIIRLARKMVPRACQMINTNGDYFKTSDDIKALFDAGLNQMQINIYSASDDSEDDDRFNNGVRLAEKREKQLKEYLAAVPGIDHEASLYQYISPSKRAAKVVKKYGVRKTIKNSEVEGPNLFSNRSGNVPGFKGALTEPLNKHCTRPFRFLNINYNGDALLCCNDYHASTSMGNIRDMSLRNIWNSDSFNIYRLKLQNKKRDCFLCDTCDFAGGYYPHMIDNVTFGKEKDSDILQTTFKTMKQINDYEI